ncbi:coiled-coil domain-containing protein 127a [Dunckerocampus dactyliophorus]|uniref:coiled-coil domain-containing protein 127a n=1 Tax=Dunckerocampus dactyliophorus TaxID=161453 RepID=UPI002405DB57|nr:coiled-coil domain-containing protein 127a [Dunckerocampus dactyliophorus]XP_054637488.1 coiled-coil domain-containing protein 127a [Dunckerocampus dactyliophorus]XP_054637489.1 coiled-coil domain-containing protein 127a [Dunckerocampus dactyliophorus]XP_054637490.1 coiled-coil domain-containing protein 127a [Dunckerocampus dactyliophorus]XP_054637491.1 coiled-coil domain-containing protein 127a [Dunckerocampus dactyliophorus]XP_054637493.1 coiled-coil domain-containing protein 127a [Duncke
MNNLNDPPRWNIQPDQREGGEGGGDGNQWNYALLVPMLGLAAFRWIWTRESQREIDKVKSQYDKDVSIVKSEMEARYQETLTERRRAAASLELELEKERQRVQGYRQAMISQSQQLVEERKRLQQERERLEEEKQRLIKSGAAGTVLHQALEQQDDWSQRANAALRELEAQLVERQNAYCSLIQPRDKRLDMEKNMLLKAVKEPIVDELDLEADLKDIFKRDKHCADLLNMDKRKNGSLMWVYLKYWQLQVTIQKHKRAEQAILGGNIKPQTK